MDWQPLAGLTVLDMTVGIAGAYCAKQFADFGARVSRIEPAKHDRGQQAEGRGYRLDPALAAGPFRDWLAADRRELLTLDPFTPSGRAAMLAHAAAADLVIEDWDAAARGDDALVDAMMTAAPGLIVVTVTPFGLTGPWAGRRGNNLTVGALSGMNTLNEEDGRPYPEPREHLLTHTGLVAAITALAALQYRRCSGRGQRADIAALDATVAVLTPRFTQHFMGLPDTGSGRSLVRCKDGYMWMLAVQERAWEAVRIVLDLHEYADDPRFASVQLRTQHREALRQLMEERAVHLTRRDIFDQLSELHGICGMALDPLDLLADPHLTARGFFRVTAAGSIPGPAIRARSTERATPDLPSAECGEQDAEALAPAHAPRWSAPLAGIRIVDLGQAWAGAYASQILGDLGAEVLKIESRVRPDPWRGGLAAYQRGTGEPGNRPYNRNSLTNSVCRNKLGLTLDLGHPRGREVFRRLVASADVVLENFTPRVMANFGLDFDNLAEVRPDVIMLSMPAYGDSGPYKDYPGIGGTIEPMSGNSALLGAADGPAINSGVMYSDAVAGLNGALAVLLALHARERGAGAQYLNLSQHEAMITLLGGLLLEAQQQGRAQRWGDGHPLHVPSGQFRCADGRYLALAVEHDDDWPAFARAAGHPDLSADVRFATLAGRRAHEQQLRELMTAWAAARTAEEAEAALVAAGLPAAVVRDIAGAAGCPHLAARGMFTSVPHSELGSFTTAAAPWRLSETPGTIRLGPPCLGEHSRLILEEIAGLSPSEVDELIAMGVTGDEPPEG